MSKLYGKQAEIANDITQSFKNYNNSENENILNNMAYISGEMGVGKTYIATEILRHFQENDKLTLIISPASTTTKWQKVIKAFTGLESAQFDKKAKTVPTSGILVIEPKNMTPLIPMFENQKVNFDFIIYDEIHTLKQKTVPFENFTKIVQSLVKKVVRNNITFRETPILGLTGTIFSQSPKKLGALINLTHPKYAKLINAAIDNDNIAKFMYYWTKISWNIALKDVESHFQSDSKDDIEQTIVPIQLIEPTDEQLAVYTIANEQLKRIQVNNRDHIAASLLDLPDQYNNLIRTRHVQAKEIGQFFATTKSYQTGFLLNDIEFEHTPKYQKLLKILKNHEKNTLIFVNDEPLINQLMISLTTAGYSPAKLKASLKAHEYSQFINEQFDNGHDIFLVNPMRISTGVDITTASRIVWYQLLSDLGSTLQAQRRVYRLSSTKSSTIHYLAYSSTYQEELIRQISESAKNNAVSYGENDTSNLAKLTGLLFT